MNLRPARSEDAEGVRHVVRAVYDEYGWRWEPDDYHFDLYDFDRYYLNEDVDFFVAEEGGEVVGCGGLVCFPLIPGDLGQLITRDGAVRVGGTDCEIARLYVLREHRGKGLGKAFNQAFIESGQRRGRKAIEIWSDKRLVEAHALYQKLGAVPAGERLCHDADQSPEWGFYLGLG